VVAGSLSLSGGRVDFNGNTHQHLQASGGSVRINGEVHGDAEVRAEQLEIGPDARIGGRLIYRGPAPPEVPESAVIAGGIEFHEQGARRYFKDAKLDVTIDAASSASIRSSIPGDGLTVMLIVTCPPVLPMLPPTLAISVPATMFASSIVAEVSVTGFNSPALKP
jgi:hypothetical protein